MNSEQQWRANQKETKDIDNLPELFASVHWLDAQGRWLEERKGMDNVGEGSLSFAAEYGGERKIASAGPELRVQFSSLWRMLLNLSDRLSWSAIPSKPMPVGSSYQFLGR